ncbi:unnamed protein product, partial [Prorocentrum cordatum]
FYVNVGPFNQLDKQLGCAALEWESQLSAHCAPSFFRLSPSRLSEDLRPILAEAGRHESWPERASIAYSSFFAGGRERGEVIQHLIVLRSAILTVPDRAASELSWKTLAPAHADDTVIREALDGANHADPQAVARSLQRHCREVSAARRTDGALLAQRFREELPEPPLGRARPGLPPPDGARRRLRRAGVGAAAAKAPRSAIGLGVAPFLAWMRLG